MYSHCDRESFGAVVLVYVVLSGSYRLLYLTLYEVHSFDIRRQTGIPSNVTTVVEGVISGQLGSCCRILSTISCG